MLIAHLILTHRNPNQLKRLVTRLSSENAFIFIHVDNKAVNFMDYLEAAKGIKNIRFITQRVCVNWGAYSMVQATINSLRQIVDTKFGFDYINLLSGMDYPLMPAAKMLAFFKRNHGHEFIHHSPFPTPDLPDGGMDRIEYYYDYDNSDTSYTSPNAGLYETTMKLSGMKRHFIKGMKPYHGSQWWSLTEKCVRHILRTIDENRQITDFYRYSKFTDEQFFQTIIMNSRFSKKVINNGLRYIDWTNVDMKNIDWFNQPPHPKTFTVEDYDRLSLSSALFARKFDEEVDSKILDMIDDHLLKV